MTNYPNFHYATLSEEIANSFSSEDHYLVELKVRLTVAFFLSKSDVKNIFGAND